MLINSDYLFTRSSSCLLLNASALCNFTSLSCSVIIVDFGPTFESTRFSPCEKFLKSQSITRISSKKIDVLG